MDDAAGNDVGDGILDRHIDIDEFLFGYNDQISGRWVRRCRHENIDINPVDIIRQTFQCRSGHEPEGIGSWMWKRHQDNFLESLVFVDKHTVDNLLGALIDVADNRNFMKQAFTQCNNLVADIALHHDTAKENQNHRGDHPQTRDVKWEKRVGMIPLRNDVQEVVHNADEEEKNV
jgi:hypothetical protein